MSDKKPVLLVIEDDPGLQAQLKWSYDDFEVVIAGDRDAALTALRAEAPQVVTLDLGLPPDPDGTSEGFAVLDAIMALKPDTKVIVASGHGARESALQAIQPGLRAGHHQIATKGDLKRVPLEMRVQPKGQGCRIGPIPRGRRAQIVGRDDLGAEAQFKDIARL
jgi:ActR/RegA family two-component response regulator